jgi:hypothetical protein
MAYIKEFVCETGEFYHCSCTLTNEITVQHTFEVRPTCVGSSLPCAIPMAIP